MKRIGKRALAALLAAVCLLLCGCGQSLSESLGKTAGERITENNEGKYHAAYIIRYTSVYQLEKNLEEGIVKKIPSTGYCVLISAPNGSRDGKGMHAVFFNDDEEFVFHFDFTEHHSHYEFFTNAYQQTNPSLALSLSLPYQLECSDFLMISSNAAWDADRSGNIPQKLEAGKWYKYSDEQFKRIFQ